eukprot:122477-Pelagomonas_calceolata.AAC.3
MASLVEEDCVESDLGTLKLVAQLSVIAVRLLAGHQASCLHMHGVAWLELCCFLLLHYISYCEVPDVSGWAAGGASSLIRNVGVKEVGRYDTIRDSLSDVQSQCYGWWGIGNLRECESTICMVTFWEGAYKAGGSYEADCMFLVVEDACVVLEDFVFHLRYRASRFSSGWLRPATSRSAKQTSGRSPPIVTIVTITQTEIYPPKTLPSYNIEPPPYVKLAYLYP